MDVLLTTEPDVRAAIFYRITRWPKRRYAPVFSHLHRHWYVGKSIPVLGRYDVVHAMDMRLPHSRGRNVFTIYDMAVFLKDHQFEAYATQRFRERKAQRYRALLKRSQAVVAISHTTKSDVLRLLEVAEDRVHVIYPGLDARYAGLDAARDLDAARVRALGLEPKRYLLFVGRATERKNAPRIIRAFLESRASKDHVLAFAGQPLKDTGEASELIQQGQARGVIRPLGYVSDGDLVHLYAGASALVYATLYEGFGLPIIEAMSCNTPVVAANRGAAPEVAAGHATLVDPFSVESIRSGIEAAIDVSGTQLAAARAHARSFTWARSARQHLDLYRQIDSG